MTKYQITIYVDKFGVGPVLLLETLIEFKVSIVNITQLQLKSLDDVQLKVALGSNDLNQLRRAVDYFNNNC